MYFKSTLIALSILASLAVAPMVNSDIPTDKSNPLIDKSSSDLAYLGWRADRARGYSYNRGIGGGGYYGGGYGYGRGFRGGYDRGYNYNSGYYSQTDSSYYDDGYYGRRSGGLFSGGLFGGLFCGC